MTTEEVFKTAELLPPAQRGALVARLLSGLDPELGPHADEWEETIERRILEMREGTVETVSREELRERLLSRLTIDTP